MARYDKYEPYAGGFRCNHAVDVPPEQIKTVIGVGLNANGLQVKGAGNTGILGVQVVTTQIDHKAGDVTDVMTSGEIVDFGGQPGTVYYSNAAGDISATGGVGTTRIGHTAEGSRLIVRVRAGAQA